MAGVAFANVYVLVLCVTFCGRCSIWWSLCIFFCGRGNIWWNSCITFRGRCSIWWNLCVTFCGQVQHLVKFTSHFLWLVQHLVKFMCHFLWQVQHVVGFGMIAGAGNVVIFNRICSWRSAKSTLGGAAGSVLHFLGRIVLGTVSDRSRIGNNVRFTCFQQIILSDVVCLFCVAGAIFGEVGRCWLLLRAL